MDGDGKSREKLKKAAIVTRTDGNIASFLVKQQNGQNLWGYPVLFGGDGGTDP